MDNILVPTSVTLFIFCFVVVISLRVIKFQAKKTEKNKMAFVKQIILGNLVALSDHEIVEFVESSREWFFERYRNLYLNSSISDAKRCYAAMHDIPFLPEHVTQEDVENSKVFMTNIFTEPFSLNNDMEAFCLNQKFTEILILKGIDESSASEYGVRIKRRFENRDMTYGIICFDIVCL